MASPVRRRVTAHYWLSLDPGEAAIAIGRQTQQANYRGQPADGSFRVTQVAIRRGHRWALAGLHLSAITQPPGTGKPGLRE